MLKWFAKSLCTYTKSGPEKGNCLFLYSITNSCVNICSNLFHYSKEVPIDWSLFKLGQRRIGTLLGGDIQNC